MAGSTPRRAVENFLRPLRKALACVTDSQLQRGGDRAGVDHALVVSGDQPFTLIRENGRVIRARVSLNYRIIQSKEPHRGPWKVRTTAYHYTLEDVDGREILSFQWHPRGVGALPYPHIHLRGAAREELREAHIPTGRVSLEEFLRFGIEAFELRTRRTDWRDVLYRERRRFEQWRTWD